MINEAADRVLRGDPLRSIVVWLIDAEIPCGPYVTQGWSIQVLRNLLTDPILIGVRRHRQKVHRQIFATGKHRSEPNPKGPETKHGADSRPYDRREVRGPCSKYSHVAVLVSRDDGGRDNSRYWVPRSQARFPFQHARCGICGELMYGCERGRMRCSRARSVTTTECWNHRPSQRRSSETINSAMGLAAALTIIGLSRSDDRFPPGGITSESNGPRTSVPIPRRRTRRCQPPNCKCRNDAVADTGGSAATPCRNFAMGLRNSKTSSRPTSQRSSHLRTPVRFTVRATMSPITSKRQ